MSSITPDQEQAFRAHLRATNARETCPICDAGRWTLRVVCGGEFLGRVCLSCNHVLLFDWGDMPQSPAASRSLASVHIGGVVQLDGEAVARAIWPTLTVCIDDELAVSLQESGSAG